MQIESQIGQIKEKMRQLPEDRSLSRNKNHTAFFNSIFTPLPFAALTAVEQLAFDENIYQKLTQSRNDLNEMVTDSFS